MSVIVCPFCNKGFRDSESRCPACGKTFSFRDWQVPEAYSADGLIPQLTIKWADNSWSPAASDFVVGRSPGCNGLVLDDPTVSNQHARIYSDGRTWKISRLKPDNSLKINGIELADNEFELSSGDKITTGISAPLEVTVEYVPKSAIHPIAGILESKSFDKLDPAEVLRIGSDAANCKIVIKNIDPCSAIIYYQPMRHSWWIVDCASVKNTKLNGQPVRNAELFDEDKISIAGIDFIFKSNMLVPLNAADSGLAVKFENLSAVTKEGRFILHNIDLQIKPGEFVGILGPSGCGKSSLIQRLAGLGSFSGGSVSVNGFPYKDKEEIIKSLTAYVPQDVALHHDLTLDEEINTFCRLHIKSSEISNEKINTVLQLVQLANERKKRIGDLSGGQKRRVTIMLELLRNPQMFLLDEPTAGLDPATETDIMLYLRRIANQGKTVLCSTHILGNLHLFDKILVLSGGEMVFWGTPSELLSFFQVDSMLELYRLLGNGTKAEQQNVARQYAEKYRSGALHKKYDPANKPSEYLPEVKHNSSIFQQITGYLYRQLLEFISFRHGKFRNFLSSAAFIQLLVQPVLIALVLKFACSSYFYVSNDYKKIFFFSAIAVFWLGLNSAIRELVHERTPWRCLERLEHINIFSYLSSKIIWSLAISTIQVAVFYAVIDCIAHVQTEAVRLDWELNNTLPENQLGFDLTIFFVLLSVCVTGSWVALAVSAFFKEENPAVGLLPIILIPVLFFSQPIMLDDNYDNYPPKAVKHVHKDPEKQKCCAKCQNQEKEEESNGQYNQLAYEIRKFMPCHEAQLFMDSKAEEARNRMLRNTLSYMFISLLLMIIFQYKNEKKWEGR